MPTIERSAPCPPEKPHRRYATRTYVASRLRATLCRMSKRIHILGSAFNPGFPIHEGRSQQQHSPPLTRREPPASGLTVDCNVGWDAADTSPPLDWRLIVGSTTNLNTSIPFNRRLLPPHTGQQSSYLCFVVRKMRRVTSDHGGARLRQGHGDCPSVTSSHPQSVEGFLSCP